MILRSRKLQLALIIGSLFANLSFAETITKAESNMFSFVVDNSKTNSSDLVQIYTKGKDYYIVKDTADEYKLSYPASSVHSIDGQLVVHLNSLGTIINNGSELVLHADTKNLEKSTFNFQQGMRVSEQKYTSSAFMNYSINHDSISKISAGNFSWYKTFDTGILYNLNTNVSTRGNNVVLDFYREQYFKDKLTALRIGSAYSASNSMTNPVSFMGVQYKKDYSLDSNYLTQPYFNFSGKADAKSVAEIFVNDRSFGAVPLDQGPYDFKNVTTGQAGNNNVRLVVKDINGIVQEVQNLSLIGSPFNLKAGTNNYSIEAGKFRLGYSRFGAPFTQGTYSYGLTDNLTLEGHVEASKAQTRVAGAATMATTYGTVKLGLAAGPGEHLVKAQYNFQKGDFYSSVQAVRSSHFKSFGNLASDIPNANLATAGYRFKGYSVSATLAKLGSAGQRESLNLNTNIGRGFASLSLNRTNRDNGISFMFSMPLGSENKWRTTTSVDRTSLGTNISESLTRSGDVNDWNMNVNSQKSQSGDKSYDATVQHATEHGIATAFVHNGYGQTGFNAGLQGAVVFDQGIHFTKPIYQGYAVVNAGEKDIPISLNNIRVATTGSDGIAIVPNTYTAFDNLVSIKADDLPLDLQVDESAVKVSSQIFFKSDVAFRIKRSPVVLVAPFPLKGMKKVAIAGKDYLVVPNGIYFDDYVAGKEYSLEVQSCKMKFTISKEVELNEKINLKCEK